MFGRALSDSFLAVFAGNLFFSFQGAFVPMSRVSRVQWCHRLTLLTCILDRFTFILLQIMLVVISHLKSCVPACVLNLRRFSAKPEVREKDSYKKTLYENTRFRDIKKIFLEIGFLPIMTSSSLITDLYLCLLFCHLHILP